MAKAKVLRTGETDIESTDIWRFCIHSDYPTQKIYEAGQTTLVIPSGAYGATKTISHSLGYAPAVNAMFQIYSGRYVKVVGGKSVGRPIDDEPGNYSVKMTSSSVVFEFIPLLSTVPPTGNLSINIQYIIFYEES
jgi:hypothetical protein